MKKIILLVIAALFIYPVATVATDDSYADVGAYFDYKTGRCEIKGDGAKLLVKNKITILNARGDKYNTIYLHEYKYAKIGGVKIRLIDADGNVVTKEGKNDMQKTCGFGASYQLYSDICTYYHEYELPEYPYSLEYEYERDIKSLFAWPRAILQGDLPVEKASYELVCPDDFEFRYKTYGPVPEPSVEQRDGKSVYHWEIDSLPAVDDVNYAPDGYPETGQIRFVADNFKLEGAEFRGKSWKNVGDWSRQLNEDCYNLEYSDFVEKYSQRIEPQTLMRSIYEIVRDEMRYVSVSIGIGGWKPHDAALTAERGYGDCKDLSTLLVSRLRLAGIESYPVDALTRGNGKIDLDFPNFNFNHVFVMAVAKDTFWMDPTCEQCPFDVLRRDDENIPVLVITDTGGVIVTTPPSAPEDNAIAKSGEVFIGADGGMSFTAEMESRGNFGRVRKSRITRLDNEELKSYITDMQPGGENRCRLIDYEIKNLNVVDSPLVITIEAASKRPIDDIGGVMYFDPNIFDTFRGWESLDFVDRTIPINFYFPSTRSGTYTIRWDSSYKFDSVHVPAADSAVFDFGAIRADYVYDADSINVKLCEKYNYYTLPVERFDDFDKLREKVKEIKSRYIKFYR